MSIKPVSYVNTLNSLVILAARYQLSISGEFNLSRYQDMNEIDNELFGDIGLKYDDSGRLDFDGGIELKFSAIGELAEIFNVCGTSCEFLVSIYNLNNEDDELENYLITDSQDCDFLNVRNDIGSDNAEVLANMLSEYWNSDKIGSKRTYSAMKLGISG